MRRSNAAASALLVLGSVLTACRADPPRESPAPRASAPLTDVAPRPEQAPGASAAASARPLRIPAPASPRSTSELPESPLWTTCSEGFTLASTPEGSTMRLGTACGPVNGLALYRKYVGTVDEMTSESSVTHRWDAERGDCFRVFAVAESSVEDLEVEVRMPKPKKGEKADDGEAVLLENQSRPWVIVSEAGPFCAHRDGELVARLSTHGGKGRYAMAVWRGAKMWKRK